MKLETEQSADGARTFEFTTKSLGRIVCAPMKVRQHIALRTAMAREHKGSYPDARQFASYLLSVLGKRADAQENAVTLKEAESLEDAELEEFAAAFLENNQWLSSDLGSPKADEESHQAYLLRAFRAYDEKIQRNCGSFAWMPKVALQTLEMFKRNEPLYKALEATRKTLPPDLFSNATLEMLKRNASISKTLAGSIGQIRAAEEASRHLAALHVEPEMRHLEFKPPPNPVHDTNRLLAEVRDVMAQAADLTKSLNDTTIGMARDSAQYSQQIILDSARYSRRMIFWAAVGVFVAVATLMITAYFNWTANRDGELLRNAVQTQSQSISELSKALAQLRGASMPARSSTRSRAVQRVSPASSTALQSAGPAHR
jgi:hypothetical protein